LLANAPRAAGPAAGELQPISGLNPVRSICKQRITHEPLIDPDTFDRVQALLPRRRNRKAPEMSYRYLLRGLIFCGHCRYTMRGKVSHVREDGSPVRAYTCGGYSQHGPTTCPFRKCYECDVLHMVGKAVSKAMDGGFEDRLRKRFRAETKSAPADLKRLRSEFRSLDEAIDGVEERWLSAPKDMLPGLERKFAEMKRRKEELTKKIARVERVAKVAGDVEQRVSNYCARLRAIGAALSDTSASELDIRGLLVECVERIECHFFEGPGREGATRSILDAVRVVLRKDSALGEGSDAGLFSFEWHQKWLWEGLEGVA
jgi:hypothetical protein